MKKLKTVELILCLVIFGMLIELNVLVFRMKGLRDRLSFLEYRINPPSLEAGEEVPGLTVTFLDGKKQRIEYKEEHKKVLLFFLSTRCPVCEKNMAAWNQLSREYPGETYGLVNESSKDTLDRYVSEKGISFPVVIPDSMQVVIEKYKIQGVPQTILIGYQGKVEGVWKGYLREERIREVREGIGLQ